MLTEKEERRTKHVVRRMLERQKGRRESEPGESRTQELLSRVGLGSESRAIARLSVQEKWFLGREGMGGYL